MHPDLSPHLHTAECNLLIKQLKKCHNEKMYTKWFGGCNEIDLQMGKCLQQERLDKMKSNRRKRHQKPTIVTEAQ